MENNCTPKTSTLSIVSLILGILSYCCLFVVTGIPAIICGHIALIKIKKSQGKITGNGMAITGLLLGYFNILIFVLFTLYIFPLVAENVGIAQEKATTLQMKMVDTNIQTYMLDNGVYPENLEMLKPEYIKETPSDMWGNPFVYEVSSNSYELFSTGADGIANNEDDIMMETK